MPRLMEGLKETMFSIAMSATGTSRLEMERLDSAETEIMSVTAVLTAVVGSTVGFSIVVSSIVSSCCSAAFEATI